MTFGDNFVSIAMIKKHYELFMQQLSFMVIGLLLYGFSEVSFCDVTTPDTEALTLSCAGCHNLKHDRVPSLDGMEIMRFLARMHAFQQDSPSVSVMSRIAPGYNEAELAAMAVFFRNRHP